MPQPPEWLRKIQQAVDNFLMSREEADRIKAETQAKLKAIEDRKAKAEASMSPDYPLPQATPPITETFDENRALMDALVRRNQALARGQQRALSEKKEVGR